MPFFSVIIPLFNKEKYIFDTLKSVINQIFVDFEIIIINDGSSDNSLDIVKSFNDERIKILNQKNLGLCRSRNNGIKASKGKFIALLDADDLWTEDFLQTIYNLINNYNDYKVFATNVKLLPKNKIANLNSKNFNFELTTVISNYFNICKNIFGPSSLVINKNIFEDVGYFNEIVNYGEEDDFYIRCFTNYNIIYYKDFKSYYRIGVENQLTAPNINFDRKIPDYELYLNKYNHKDLKKFIDYVYFRLVVLFKMEKNYKLVNFYKNKINPSNLSLVQKIKFYLPTDLFYNTKKIYIWFSKTFIHS